VYARTPPEVPAVSAVPPFATGSAVPEYVNANVPEDVIGLPEMLRRLGTVAATLVTVPLVVVGLALNTAAPAPAPSVTIIAFVPVAMVIVAPVPCAIAID